MLYIQNDTMPPVIADRIATPSGEFVAGVDEAPSGWTCVEASSIGGILQSRVITALSLVSPQDLIRVALNSGLSEDSVRDVLRSYILDTIVGREDIIELLDIESVITDFMG